ncbi:MAG: hypothetical protein ABFS19_13155 [Thermodesulfobacteriota bacterium]
MSDTQQSLSQAIHNCCTRFNVQNLDSDDRKLTASFLFPVSFPGFGGHFPGHPILAAIIQLAAVRHSGELGLGYRLRPVNYTTAKFRTVIGADQEITVTMDLTKNSSDYAGEFVISTGDSQKISEGSCLFQLI